MENFPWKTFVTFHTQCQLVKKNITGNDIIRMIRYLVLMAYDIKIFSRYKELHSFKHEEKADLHLPQNSIYCWW